MITYGSNTKKVSTTKKSQTTHKIRNLNLIDYATVTYDYVSTDADELTLKVGDVIEVVSTDEEMSGIVGWWLGRKQNEDKYGVFPRNYIVMHSGMDGQ